MAGFFFFVRAEAGGAVAEVVHAGITRSALASLGIGGIAIRKRGKDHMMERTGGNRNWLVPLAFAAVLLAACQRQASDPQQVDPQPTAAPAATAPAVQLKDVSESDPRYIVGISYPPGINKYPGLAAELKKYSDATRAELQQAIDGMGDEPPTAPYDLSLAYTQLVETPDVVAIAADGSSYTGGAHGNPLIARFVWLPRQSRLLTAATLVPNGKSWEAISGFAREQLMTSLSQRLDSDEFDGADRADMLRNAGRMIDEGTTAEPENFAQFEPVMAEDGRIRALRFVFPPYQVGPYSDGTQTVEVPASVLLPNVASEYRSLFAGA